MIDNFIMYMGWNIPDILWLDLTILGSILLVLGSGPAVMYVINRYERRNEGERSMIGKTASQIHLEMQQAQMQNQYHPGGLGSMAGMAGGIMGNALDGHYPLEGNLRELAQKLDALQAKIYQMEGFYTWMVHTHPDKIAEYKAIQDVMESIKARDES